jgi:DNA-binding NarL/FixJ family response regulator
MACTRSPARLTVPVSIFSNPCHRPRGDAGRGSARPRLRSDPDTALDAARLASLTRQEQRILGLLAQARTNRQIAAQMYLAEKTVKNYVSNLLLKLGMQNRTEAAVYFAKLPPTPAP